MPEHRPVIGGFVFQSPLGTSTDEVFSTPMATGQSASQNLNWQKVLRDYPHLRPISLYSALDANRTGITKLIWSRRIQRWYFSATNAPPAACGFVVNGEPHGTTSTLDSRLKEIKADIDQLIEDLSSLSSTGGSSSTSSTSAASSSTWQAHVQIH